MMKCPRCHEQGAELHFCDKKPLPSREVLAEFVEWVKQERKTDILLDILGDIERRGHEKAQETEGREDPFRN